MSDRLEALKEYADEKGIKYHPSIGEQALEEKIREFEAAASAEPTVETASEPTQAAPAATKTETPRERMRRIKNEQLKLVRVRITCMNPNKKEWEGEIITVSNALVGTIKKYVPFNAEEGWHIPQIMLNVLKEREFQHFHIVRDDRGNKVTQGKQVKEFAIEILPALTEEELKELARKQAVRKG